MGWVEAVDEEAGVSEVHSIMECTVVVVVAGGALQVHMRFPRYQARAPEHWGTEDTGNPTTPITGKSWRGRPRNELGKLRNGR